MRVAVNGDVPGQLVNIVPAAQTVGVNGIGTVHHVAFAVDGLRETLTELDEADIKLIDREPRKGAEGLNIAFLHPKSTHGVLTELCEQEKISAWGWI